MAEVCLIVGRDVPDFERLSRAQLKERQDAEYFASATKIMAEEALAVIPTESEERSIHTKLLIDLKADPVAVYRNWRKRNYKFAAALVKTGQSRERHLKDRLWTFVNAMADEEDRRE